MLDRLDRDLMSWIASLPNAPDVVLRSPDDSAADRRISLHLLDVRPDPPQRNTNHSTWPFRVRYLVSASAADPMEQHALLGNLMMAALERSGTDIEPDAPPLELWRAFGVKPRPAFILSVAWSYQKDAPQRPTVKHPLSVDSRPVGPMSGVVLGPEDAPIMAARLEIPALGLSTTSDRVGHFHFAGTPRGADLRLRITARGKTLERSSRELTGHDGNLIVRLEL